MDLETYAIARSTVTFPASQMTILPLTSMKLFYYYITMPYLYTSIKQMCLVFYSICLIGSMCTWTSVAEMLMQLM